MEKARSQGRRGQEWPRGGCEEAPSCPVEVLEPGPGLRRLRWGAGSPACGGSRFTRAWGGGDTHKCPCPRAWAGSAPTQCPWPP